MENTFKTNMKKQIILLFTTMLIVSAFAIVGINATSAAPNAQVSFANDVRPILESRCSNCHMGEFTSAELHMDTYESLMAGSENGPVIVPGDPNASLLVEKISKGEMPERGPRLTPVQIQVIVDWIQGGAQNN